MKGYWDQFIVGFCKVDFVCWQGEPNWIGWIFIGIFTLILLIIALAITVPIAVKVIDWYKYEYNYDPIIWFWLFIVLFMLGGYALQP